jgi:putative addiction module killer protein
MKGKKIILLLCGGDKGTQNKDIQKAKIFWEDYLKSRNKE